jgi:hypothetical protein
MVKRGLYKKSYFQISEGGKRFVNYKGDLTSISRKTDRNIEELGNKTYAVHDLSLFALIESILVETSKTKIPVDTLKLEIIMILIDRESIFRNNRCLLSVYKENTPSINEYWDFFPILQSYLFDIGKMLVTEKKHDCLINKEFKGGLTLTPSEDFDKKYIYFKNVDYYYLDEAIYRSLNC